MERLWRATCRVLAPDGKGSGFFVDSAADGTVVVTNAHVVRFHPWLVVEWMDQATIVQRPAAVIAIDYPHDLAILSVAHGPTPVGSPLELGDPPRPGEELWLCGYPLEAETPRLTRAVVSGWDIYRNLELADGFEVSSLVLDGSINFGNSGGPLCDSSGRVVGVVCAQHAQRLFISPSAASLPDDQQRTLEQLSRHLNTGTGIGFALHPAYVRKMLGALENVPPRAREPYAPELRELQMPRQDFVALQIAAVQAKEASIGPYSMTSSGEYFIGWYPKRIAPVPPSAAWAALAPSISPTGGSFFLLGFDIHLSRQRKDHRGSYYTIPVRLRLTE